MMWEYVIAGIVVTVAAVVLIRQLYKAATGKDDPSRDCCSGCRNFGTDQCRRSSDRQQTGNEQQRTG